MPSVGQFKRYIDQTEGRIEKYQNLLMIESQKSKEMGMPSDLAGKKKLSKCMELMARYKLEVDYAKARLDEHREGLVEAEALEARQSLEERSIKRSAVSSDDMNSAELLKALRQVSKRLERLEVQVGELKQQVNHSDRKAKALIKKLF